MKKCIYFIYNIDEIEKVISFLLKKLCKYILYRISMKYLISEKQINLKCSKI
jgi:hypothetical protein